MLVLAVWGTVAYKIISALNPELPQIKQYDFATNTNYRIDTKIDTFSIETVNRDPFLGTVLVKEKKPKKTVKAKPIQWLPVEYQGIVNGTNGKNQIFIISINGNQKLLKKGQTQDSVTLVYGNSKLVKMRYKNQLKSFPLKK